MQPRVQNVPDAPDSARDSRRNSLELRCHEAFGREPVLAVSTHNCSKLSCGLRASVNAVRPTDQAQIRGRPYLGWHHPRSNSVALCPSKLDAPLPRSSVARQPVHCLNIIQRCNRCRLSIGMQSMRDRAPRRPVRTHRISVCPVEQDLSPNELALCEGLTPSSKPEISVDSCRCCAHLGGGLGFAARGQNRATANK